MKKQLIVFVLSALFVFELSAQEDKKLGNPWSLGFQLSEYHNDFGLGLNITSPYFLHGAVAAKIRGNFMFFQHPQNNETVETSYNNIALGIELGRQQLGSYLAIYGEGGAMGIIPSSEFSDEDLVVGGYGLFGFEFLTQFMQ